MTTSTDQIHIAIEDPLSSDLELLFRRHVEAMHADTPPESIHMIPRESLVSPGISFFVMRQGGQPVAMGAMKAIDPTHAELKSMHVLAEMRGKGLSRLLLDHLVGQATAAGIGRLSLETGAQPSFAAARGLYLRAGFMECAPFADYRPDPNSIYMTIEL
ncbi:GNAT family N-acetyltransferase [Paracoccus sp. Z330]|uniref:GNAT family N-acetyltransferase n=1 Tax=Paracoccus onchidii TaxID=3017813 RepID=A0ABT4ZCA0_9RHOB|nr:GNAT family N-acetyltransferase [Paracoccus onchidii]MDB6176991.1 GNAT family N-acetyltransferase [Paracoccus onchidii]